MISTKDFVSNLLDGIDKQLREQLDYKIQELGEDIPSLYIIFLSSWYNNWFFNDMRFEIGRAKMSFEDIIEFHYLGANKSYEFEKELKEQLKETVKHRIDNIYKRKKERQAELDAWKKAVGV